MPARNQHEVPSGSHGFQLNDFADALKGMIFEVVEHLA